MSSAPESARVASRLPRSRRRKTSAAARVRRFWILIVVSLVLAAGVGFAVSSWPGFYPQRIVVEGNRIVPSPAILSEAAIVPERNIWLQNTRAMVARIEQLPYVKSAAVHRRPPHTITIDVTERVPVAVLSARGRRALVDDDLRVLQTGDSASALPVLVLNVPLLLKPGSFVTQPDAIALLNADRALLSAHVVPVGLSLDRYGDLVATMRGGIRLLLGDDSDFEKKLALIDPILSQLARQRRPIAAIDLRAPSTPVIVYK